MHQAKKRKLQNIVFYLSAFLAMGVIIGYNRVHNAKMEQELNSNMAFANGKIIRIGTSRGHKYICYEYKVKGKAYTQYMDDGDRLHGKADDSLFLNKKFPVVYDSLDASYARILIFREQFQKYGFAIPTYMNWIEDFHKPPHSHS